MADSKFIRKIFHFYFLLKRPLTMGVRVIVENDNGEILLVKHSYVSGWYLPGGGVETHETFEETALKELREETGVELLEAPKLLAIYKNKHASKRDHVVLYKAGKWREAEAFKPNKEIVEIGFFPLDDLPKDITAGNLARLEEHYSGKPLSSFW